MQKTITLLSLCLFSICGTTLFAQQAANGSPRKNSIYFEGAYLRQRGKEQPKSGTIFDGGSGEPFFGYGFAAFNYERQLYVTKQNNFKAGLSAGFTPPINAQVQFAYNVGPKFYWGRNKHWLCIDARYCEIFSKHINSSLPRGTFVHRKSHSIYAGLGYCFTGKKGFYLNPELVICGDNYNLNKPDQLYVGTTMSLGYCF